MRNSDELMEEESTPSASKATAINSNESVRKHVCEICDKNFAQAGTLGRHKLLHKSERRFKCCRCDRAFTRNDHLQVHFKTHDKREDEDEDSTIDEIMPTSLKCKECGETFTRTSHLFRHMREHVNAQPFKCKQCGKAFSRKENLQRHSLTHTSMEDRPFPCSRCSMAFITKARLQSHEKLHDRPKPYKCEDCGEAFNKKNKLTRHRVIHTGKKPYLCPEEGCEESFMMPSALRRHQLRIHTGITYICPTESCNVEPFKTYEELQLHLREHKTEIKYNCDHCGKLFSRSGLQKHKKMHEGVFAVDRMNYRCIHKNCTAAYACKSSLRNHVKAKHSPQEKLKCDVCLRTFSLKGNLRAHKRRVHSDDMKKELRYSCRECNDRFETRNTLRRHLRHMHQQSFIRPEDVISDESSGSETLYLVATEVAEARNHLPGTNERSESVGTAGISERKAPASNSSMLQVSEKRSVEDVTSENDQGISPGSPLNRNMHSVQRLPKTSKLSTQQQLGKRARDNQAIQSVSFESRKRLCCSSPKVISLIDTATEG